MADFERKGVLNLEVGTTYVPDNRAYAEPDDEVEVPCLIVNDEIVWTAPVDTYWDAWGDGGPTAEDVVGEYLGKALADVPR